nr:hypothetical protein HK105_000246 [Polyrhizophydium stewartii]
MSTISYPPTRRDDSVVDTLHGVAVPDPYRWLEDPDSDETKAFVDAQNAVTQTYLSQCAYRDDFKRALTGLFNYDKYGCPRRHGGQYFYFHNSGLQPQSVLYKQASLDAERQVFLDPNTLSDDGTVSINTFAFSDSGKLFGYALSASGSDWVNIHVRETRDGVTKDLEDKPIEWAKFTTIGFTHDDRGFFYTTYPRPQVDASKKGTETDANKNSMVYYHVIGTPQEQDILIHKDPANPDFLQSAYLSDDGKFVVMSVSKGTNPETALYVAPIDGPITSDKVPVFVAIADKMDAAYTYLTNEGRVFWLATTLNAPKQRIVKYDLDHPEKGFVEVIAETENVISSVDIADNNKLMITYLEDVKHVVYVYDMFTGAAVAPHKLPLPEGSIISSLQSSCKHGEVFYLVSSFLSPGVVYRFDFEGHQHSVFRQAVVKGLRADELETKQIFYESKDGTKKIPMFIIARKDVKLDGNNPTVLYGYGGFDISITPSFSVSWLTFVQHMKGVVAIANIRGGGEYGQEKWYNQGRLAKKQNVFDDFQWAAKWLSAHGYARPEKLAINGGSNGGLLVGACINQAPELFGAAVAQVGVLDMYRFHRFTIGAAWTSDYGNPDKADDFAVLQKYSPLHNVHSDKEYPAVLIMTGDHDDRVVPLHSHKFIATLQHARPHNAKPLLERVETKAGHGAGKSTQQLIEDTTDKFAFIGLAVGAEWSE